MKPIIIYAMEYDGKITIDKAAFEKAIQDAYEQGKADGYKNIMPWFPDAERAAVLYPAESYKGLCSYTADAAHSGNVKITSV